MGHFFAGGRHAANLVDPCGVYQEAAIGFFTVNGGDGLVGDPGVKQVFLICHILPVNAEQPLQQQRMQHRNIQIPVGVALVR